MVPRSYARLDRMSPPSRGGAPILLGGFHGGISPSSIRPPMSAVRLGRNKSREPPKEDPGQGRSMQNQCNNSPQTGRGQQRISAHFSSNTVKRLGLFPPDLSKY